MYTKYYGLFLKPFENAPDPKFLFPSKSHREVLAALRYGIDNVKGFILIAGDVGTGKTTMINALLKEIDPSYIIFNINNPKWSFDEIIRYLAIKFKINIENEANFQILEKLQTILEKIDYVGKRVVLIIDEAHLLSESTLEDIRLISNIEKENKKLIQIVLVGQEEIYDLLQRESLKTLKQRIMINRNLEPLSKKETIDYINHRLRIGGRKSQLFSKKAVALIWKRSQGVPRLINHICDNALLIGFAGDARLIGPKIIKEVINDMDSGYKNFEAVKFWHTRNLKWIGATLAIVLLMALFVKYFFAYDPKVLQNVLPDNNVSENKSEESTDRYPSNSAKLQESFSPRQEKHSDTGTSPQAKNSKKLNKDNNIYQETNIALAENVSVEKTGNQITPSIPHQEDVIREIASEKKYLLQRVVKRNDYISKIAKETYGAMNQTVIDLIHMANPEIKDINRIFAGQKINLPLIERKGLIKKDIIGNYSIHYASFYELENASRCLKELWNQDQKSFMIRTKQEGNKVYRVYYGNYKNLQDARKQLESLELEYLYFVK
jgi:general secretion pathway protein A